MKKYLIGTSFCVPLRIYSKSVAKQIPMIDKCVYITSTIHLGELALIMFFFKRKIYFINQQRKSMEIFTISKAKRHQE